MSPSKYVQKVVIIFEEYVAKHWGEGHRLPRRAESPFAIGYCTGLDVSPVG